MEWNCIYGRCEIGTVNQEIHRIMRQRDKICPLCHNELIPLGKRYTINELFNLWRPIIFPEALIQKHAEQSGFTQRYSCPICFLQIFLPKIIGTSDFYEYLSQHETASYYEDTKWEFNEAIVDIERSDAVIEIGCGPGNFLKKIEPIANEVCGTEFNELALTQAKKKGLNVFGVGDNTRHLKNRFDKVFAFHVLEHVKDPVDFINDLFYFAKKDGSVCLSVPNQNGPVKYINPCIQNMPPHHATVWDFKTFQHLAKRMDLEISRHSYEPLKKKDSYYYTIHFPSYIVSPHSLQKRILNNLIRRVIKLFLDSTFKILSAFSKNEITFLKGQSLYVSLKKSKKVYN